ncbi:MAG: hypothetical protein AAGI54_12770 [Planctomycetota bacterium]
MPSGDNDIKKLVWVVAFVFAVALTGMVAGALFGVVTGLLAPKFFTEVLAGGILIRDPLPESDALGIAVMLGGFGGVMCGGALGCFAVLVRLVLRLFGRERE